LLLEPILFGSGEIPRRNSLIRIPSNPACGEIVEEVVDCPRLRLLSGRLERKQHCEHRKRVSRKDFHMVSYYTSPVFLSRNEPEHHLNTPFNSRSTTAL
jgi:hypothetical protein